MKKLFLLFALVMLAGSITAQRTVQGIVRNDLKSTKAMVKAATPLDTTFTFRDIQFWVGEGANEAAMVLSWHDGSTSNPDHMVWGYKWPAGETRTGLDMIKAIASADKRALLLIQYTGSMGYTINGIGYDEDPANLDIAFDANSAKANVSFLYPANAQEIADQAIIRGQSSGVIEHPFNANVGGGRPAYDYDYWKIDRDFYPSTHWNAGWYKGYWGYFNRNAKNQDWEYSNWGAFSRELTNGTWDAWSYNGDMSSWEGTKPGYPLVAASYVPRETVKQVLSKVAPAAQAIYTDNGLSLKNLQGYTVYISSISGVIASTFKIASEEETKQLNLAPGIYTCTAVKGTEKVAVKFVVK